MAGTPRQDTPKQWFAKGDAGDAEACDSPIHGVVMRMPKTLEEKIKARQDEIVSKFKAQLLQQSANANESEVNAQSVLATLLAAKLQSASAKRDTQLQTKTKRARALGTAANVAAKQKRQRDHAQRIFRRAARTSREKIAELRRDEQLLHKTIRAAKTNARVDYIKSAMDSRFKEEVARRHESLQRRMSEAASRRDLALERRGGRLQMQGSLERTGSLPLEVA